MLLRVAVVIPVHGHLRTISEVVKDVVLQTPFPILLVDDGSDSPVSNALYSFEVKQALESGRLRVTRFESRRGKGAALRFAIGELVKQGYTHMVTLAADGRVPATEIGRLVSTAKAHPWAVIVGSSRGSKFESFRLYPLFALQSLKTIAQESEFDVEVLTRLIWRRFEVQVVAVREQPGEAEERVSWFFRGLEFFRVKLFLFMHGLVSLWLESRSPGIAALVVGGAVFLASLTVREVEGAGATPQWMTMAGSALLGIGLGTIAAGLVGLVFILRHRRDRKRQRGFHVGPTPVERILNSWSPRLGRRAAQPFVRAIALLDYLTQTELRRALNEFYRLRDPRSTFWLRQKSVYRHLIARVSGELETTVRLRLNGVQHLKTLTEGCRGMVMGCTSIGEWARVEDAFFKQVPSSNLMNQRIDLAGGMNAQIELIPFMGRLAPIDIRPFVRAAQSGDAVVAVFAFKGEGDVFEVYLRPPRLSTPRRDRPLILEILPWVREYLALVEGFLKKYPEHWNIPYPFWSELPIVRDGENHLIEELSTRSAPPSRATLESRPLPELTY